MSTRLYVTRYVTPISACVTLAGPYVTPSDTGFTHSRRFETLRSPGGPTQGFGVT